MSPLWTDEDSDALDAQVRALRQAERRARSKKGTPPVTLQEAKQAVAAGTRYTTTLLPTINAGRKRPGMNTNPPPAPLHPALIVPGQAPPSPSTPEPPRRRTRRPGKPKQQPNGRWHAVINIRHRRYGKTFDTEPEAQEWLDQMDKRRND
jgi:hypothetical protein